MTQNKVEYVAARQAFPLIEVYKFHVLTVHVDKGYDASTGEKKAHKLATI